MDFYAAYVTEQKNDNTLLNSGVKLVTRIRTVAVSNSEINEKLNEVLSLCLEEMDWMCQ